MSKTDQSGTAQDLLKFLEWLGSRGQMKHATVGAYSSAVRKVMEIEGDDWRSHDVRSIDVDALLRRFERLRAREYTPDSMKAYQSHFRRAHQIYMAFLRDGQAGLQPLIRERHRRSASSETRVRTSDNDGATEPKDLVNVAMQPDDNLVTYPFPIRRGKDVESLYLFLPRDLHKTEADRLCAFLHSLAIDPKDLEE